jgi:hypothetical protein
MVAVISSTDTSTAVSCCGRKYSASSFVTRSVSCFPGPNSTAVIPGRRTGSTMPSRLWRTSESKKTFDSLTFKVTRLSLMMIVVRPAPSRSTLSALLPLNHLRMPSKPPAVVMPRTSRMPEILIAQVAQVLTCLGENREVDKEGAMLEVSLYVNADFSVLTI